MAKHIFRSFLITMLLVLFVSIAVIIALSYSDFGASSATELASGLIGPLVVIVLVTILVVSFTSQRIERRIVRPLNEINLDAPLENEVYDELAPLLRRLAQQQYLLQVQQRAQEQRKKELNTIIDSMKEGMILLSEQGKIVSINHTAMRLLGANRSCVGKTLLEITRNMDLNKAVNGAYNGESRNDRLELEQRIYQIMASPIQAQETVAGVAVLLLDITQSEEADRMRREFTANVSHELKTPLHSISGYAELLKCGMVQAEDVKIFGENIYTEAQRLIRLVEDIISLSHLDEGAVDLTWDTIEIANATKSVLVELQAFAEEKSIAIISSLEEGRVYAIPQLLHSILHNLCENAIKYNRLGGTVTVATKVVHEQVVLSVKDTGVGLSREEQERMFERFYRADKSHSQEISGTGLGLSIVKHAVQILQAKIEVISQEGVGTEIIVTFDKKE